jgi:general secretion pathway protein D
LKVKPRVSANGTVTMLVSQELSSVTGGTADNPTFSQRTVSSTVSVPSSQTVALGGLISGQETRGKKSVPLLNKVPVIGDLVGKTENIARRTELIVFITPQVIQDGEDASRVSEELRERMRNLGFN